MQTSAATLSQIFDAANAAKDYRNYEVANFLFAYLLQSHARNTEPLKIGIEYAPIVVEGNDWHGEGDPCKYKNITNEVIKDTQYHAIVFIYIGGTAEQPENYLCIPAPLLSTEALRYAWRWAKKQGGFMPRRNHERHDLSSTIGSPEDLQLLKLGGNTGRVGGVPASLHRAARERVRLAVREFRAAQMRLAEILTGEFTVPAWIFHTEPEED